MSINNATDLTKMLNNLEEVIKFMDNFNELKDIKSQMLSAQTDFENLLNLSLENVKLSKSYITIINELIHNKLYLIDKTVDLEKNKIVFEDLRKKLLELSSKHFKELSIANLDNILRIRKLEGESRVFWFKLWAESEYKKEYFKPIITAFSNWEYPTMELFPGIGEFLPYALGAEPLYIVDTDEYLLEKCSSQFNEFYANKRLMKYKIEENYSLKDLPKNSFGFIYNLNYSFAEEDTVNFNIAKEVFDCLMPGGTYLFSYIPSDKWWGVELMESQSLNGLNTRNLVSTLEIFGFTDIKVNYDTAMTTHILAKKPGEIEYIKGSSILAKIIDKPSDLL